MVSSMTILEGKEACEIEKIRKMGIKIQDDGENYLLEVTGIVDTGADVCGASDEMPWVESLELEGVTSILRRIS